MLFPELTNYLFLAAFLAPPFFLPPFFAAFFLVAILSFLLLSQGEDHKMLCCCSSCGQEKTAHNMLLYKLNSKACQQFITAAMKKLLRIVLWKESSTRVDEDMFALMQS